MDYLYTKDRLLGASLASFETLGLNGKYISGGSILIWLIISFIIVVSFINFLYSPESSVILKGASDKANQDLSLLYKNL